MEGDSINSDYMSKCLSLGILRSWRDLQNNQIWRESPLLFPDSIQLHSSPIPSRLSCSLRCQTKALARELFHRVRCKSIFSKYVQLGDFEFDHILLLSDGATQ